jgi:hypothetical protein
VRVQGILLRPAATRQLPPYMTSALAPNGAQAQQGWSFHD